MKITFAEPALPTSGRWIVPIFEDGKLPSESSSLLPKDARQGVERALKASRIASQAGGHATLFALPGLGKAKLTLWGVGSREEFDAESFGAMVMAAFRSGDDRALVFHLSDRIFSADDAARVAVGARLAGYRFDKHRSQRPPGSATIITGLALHTGQPAQARKCYRSFYGPICDGQLLARDLVNEPANVLFPKAYAKRIRALKASGLEIEVLGERAMKELKMNALVGVGQGSRRESQLVIMKWKGGKAKQAPVCLVGKGITFDSGGISLKNKDGMWNMKGDMGGSAAVVGAMHSLALRKAKVNVIGIVALAENMPDGNAQNPGDVITSMSGQTIELQSTDAEGRLVLADALWYAKERFRPCSLIDLATLTGAKVVALGSEHAGLFSNRDELAEQFATSSATARERTWRLPLLPEYDQLLESETADMKNSVAGPGAITAAQFLQRFVGDIPWVHLDIAGSSHKLVRTDPREPSFAIGFGVRLLNQWLADHHEA